MLKETGKFISLGTFKCCDWFKLSIVYVLFLSGSLVAVEIITDGGVNLNLAGFWTLEIMF